MRLSLAAVLLLTATILASLSSAAPVDPASEPAPVLRDLVDALDGRGIDVLYSHDSENGRTGPSYGDRPRLAPLLGFRAWANVPVDLPRYGEWLDAFADGARGALAAVAGAGDGGRPEREAFEEIWKDADEGQRVFVTFDRSDLEIAEAVAAVLEEQGFAVYLAVADPDGEPLDPAVLGRLFIGADHWLTIDTASARLNPVIQFEAELLAELRRQHDWVASADAGLPPIRRGSMDVVESLGALPMKILPGGIVLGMRPLLDADLGADRAAARRHVDGSDYGIVVGDRTHVLEQVSRETREAIDEFVRIEDSHSVVDIAGDRATLAAPFDGTRIGDRLARADRLPFDHLSVRGAKKSLLVDRAIRFRDRGEGRLAADVTLELRFYRTDDDGHADRLATLAFTVEDATGSARLLDLSWSRRPGMRIGFDGHGVEHLVDDLEQLAVDAALVAVARLETPAPAPVRAAD
jgi:hypothetical protein